MVLHPAQGYGHRIERGPVGERVRLFREGSVEIPPHEHQDGRKVYELESIKRLPREPGGKPITELRQIP